MRTFAVKRRPISARLRGVARFASRPSDCAVAVIICLLVCLILVGVGGLVFWLAAPPEADGPLRQLPVFHNAAVEAAIHAEDLSVDVVYTWVNGADPTWQAARAMQQAAPSTSSSSRSNLQKICEDGCVANKTVFAQSKKSAMSSRRSNLQKI